MAARGETASFQRVAGGRPAFHRHPRARPEDLSTPPRMQSCRCARRQPGNAIPYTGRSTDVQPVAASADPRDKPEDDAAREESSDVSITYRHRPILHRHPRPSCRGSKHVSTNATVRLLGQTLPQTPADALGRSTHVEHTAACLDPRDKPEEDAESVGASPFQRLTSGQSAPGRIPPRSHHPRIRRPGDQQHAGAQKHRSHADMPADEAAEDRAGDLADIL